jgi:hypothetical protein
VKEDGLIYVLLLSAKLVSNVFCSVDCWGACCTSRHNGPLVDQSSCSSARGFSIEYLEQPHLVFAAPSTTLARELFDCSYLSLIRAERYQNDSLS